MIKWMGSEFSSLKIKSMRDFSRMERNGVKGFCESEEENNIMEKLILETGKATNEMALVVVCTQMVLFMKDSGRKGSHMEKDE